MKKSLPHNAYEELADSYAQLIDTKAHNAYYDRPAVQSLVPDVKNRKILDAGCGPGVYTEWLLNRGAAVTALDENEKMLFHAKNRVGGRAVFYNANLEEPLDFLKDDSFDGVLCPLVVAYIKEHSPLFHEFNRVLHKDGWFIFSTEHPFFSYGYFHVENYFETKQVNCDWHGFEKVVNMPSYYHSLGTMADALTENGFAIDKILEPKPTEQFREADPGDYQKLMQFPVFICIRARKIADI